MAERGPGTSSWRAAGCALLRVVNSSMQTTATVNTIVTVGDGVVVHAITSKQRLGRLLARGACNARDRSWYR